jgi:hypothetical protein
MTPKAPTVQDIITIVDELANISTPTPASTIIRVGLITELRTELRPNLGRTTPGRGDRNRLPIDTTALAVWEDVTTRIQALHIDLNGTPATTGSLEQILNAWARDLVAAELTTPNGLNEPTLRLMHHRVTSIRNRIRNHLDPYPAGDIPGAQCPVCGADIAHVLIDGEEAQMPAIGWSKPPTGLTVECRNPACLTTWTGDNELRILEHEITVFRTLFAPTNGTRS